MRRVVNTVRYLPLALAALALAACDPEAPRNGPQVETPGASRTMKTRALELGAAALQERAPVEALSAYLDGFHFYSGRLDGQMEAHHYCANLDEEVTQCVIYDGTGSGSRLMGVEYIVSRRLFESLPEAEKSLWHSHVHEVKSGQLIAPGIPQAAEHELMEKLVDTYGKTWHTWHTDAGKELPLGVPQLMIGFTADGQADPAMIAKRDERLGIDSTERRSQRSDIAAPAVAAGADAWQHGKAPQIADPLR